MDRSSRIYVAGHRGLVGAAVVRELQRRGYSRLILRSRDQVDLRDREATRGLFAAERPQYVFLAAGTVGGILANSTRGAEFLYDNLMIAANVMEAAREHGVVKLLNLGSSCIYPRLAPQPIREEHLLTGPLEPTNEPYAVAKIAAVKLAAAYNAQFGTEFLSVMPTNLYGPHDNFDLESSHVVPAIMRKMHEARTKGGPAVLWGDGSPRRELLYVDDLADALVHLMETCSAAQAGELVNIGTGADITIRELAAEIADVVGFTGEVRWDASRPNGTPRKLLDVSRMAGLGWRAKTPLREGLRLTYQWFLRAVAGEPAG